MDFEDIWVRIERLSGEAFRTKTGKAFTFDCARDAVRLRTTNRNLSKTQFAAAWSRFPVPGPGALQDLQGPSYLYAILTDPRITDENAATAARLGCDAELENHRAVEAAAPAQRPLSGHISRLDRPGTPVSQSDLKALGFTAHQLRFHPAAVPLTGGRGRAWDTLGTVPDGPGLYAFTTSDPTTEDALRVRYVGLSAHLWMVTHGRLPDGTARGGQRYGRPRHAGETRKRVNIEVAKAHEQGLQVLHWLCPVTVPDGENIRVLLRREEERLITRWRLREFGWNRG